MTGRRQVSFIFNSVVYAKEDRCLQRKPIDEAESIMQSHNVQKEGMVQPECCVQRRVKWL